MTTFLLILQISAGLFTAAAAVAGLLKSKGIIETEKRSFIIGAPPTLERRMSRPAFIGLVSVICDLLVSTVAGILKQTLENARIEKSQQAASNQLAIAQATLASIQRVITRFEDLRVSIDYELPVANNTVREFVTNLLTIARDASPAGIRLPTAIESHTNSEGLVVPSWNSIVNPAVVHGITIFLLAAC